MINPTVDGATYFNKLDHVELCEHLHRLAYQYVTGKLTPDQFTIENVRIVQGWQFLVDNSEPIYIALAEVS